MYLEENIEFNSLRQGDILSSVHLLGVINLNGIQYLTSAAGEKKGWTIPNAPIYADVIVLSHSCEIASENDIKLTSIILAPIRDIHTATAPEKIDDLKRSNFITSSTEASYLKYFYIEPHDKLQFKDGAIVDFSKPFSVRKNCYDFLLRKKILQLAPEIAEKMVLKLALYFHRKNIFLVSSN